jgi:inner membrane protein
MQFFQTLSGRLALFLGAALLSTLVLILTLHGLKQAPKSIIAPIMNPQHITAPLLVVPYVDHFVSVETVASKEGESKVVSKDVYTDHTAIVLPTELSIHATLNPDNTALVILKGKVDYQPLLEKNPDNERNVRWDKAQLLVGIKDLTALREPVKVFWNDDHMELQADTQSLPNLGKGFYVDLPESKEQSRYQTFEIQLPLQTGSHLTFTPTGRKTQLEIIAPSTLGLQAFGAIKPTTKISSTGTNSTWSWSIPDLIRGYPTFWIQDQVKPFDLHQAALGVELKAKINLLETTWNRLIQWGFVLLALILLVGLSLELLSGRPIHWLHYTVLGVSVSLMYLLLMSLESVMPFFQALQWCLGLIASFTSLILGMILGWRAFILAGIFYTGIVGSFYLLATLPAHGVMGMVICAGLIGLLVIMGSLRFLNPFIEDTGEPTDTEDFL